MSGPDQVAINSRFTVKVTVRVSVETLISFTHKDSWAKTQVPDLIVKVAMLPRGQVSHIKVKAFIARVGP